MNEPDEATLKAIAEDGEPAKPTILDEARNIIYGERQKVYGPSRPNHERIAAHWSVILGIPVSAEQVVLCMIGLKLARLGNTPDHRDSWVDIAGYVGVYDKMQRGE